MRWQTGASCIAFALLWAVMTVARAEVREVDRAFVQQAIMAGYAAIASGEAALASKNPAIAAFGERMVREHAAMIDELASVAAAKGMELPTGASLPDQAEGLMLGILPGATFDRTYVEQQLVDHEVLLDLLRKEASSGQDADLRSFADRYVLVIEAHIDELQELRRLPELQ
jgi:putative membrane protein